MSSSKPEYIDPSLSVTMPGAFTLTDFALDKRRFYMSERLEVIFPRSAAGVLFLLLVKVFYDYSFRLIGPSGFFCVKNECRELYAW